MSYTKAVQEYDRRPDQERRNECQCQICHSMTLTETLLNRGGMCQRCFSGYEEHGAMAQNRVGLGPNEGLIVGRSRDVDVGDKRIDALSWARALKRREDAGDRLTEAQKEMWRYALRREIDSGSN